MQCKTVYLLLAFCLVVTSMCGANIVETLKARDLEEHLDADTLLLVDIDNTLLIPGQYLGTTRWGWNHTSRLERLARTREAALKETYELFHQIWQVSDVCLLDDEFPALIAEHQDRGGKVVAISNRDPSLMFITIEQLESVGIDLSINAVCDQPRLIGEGPRVAYNEGVLLVGEMGNKGQALDAFLTELDYRPTKICFVDDRMKNVQRVERALQRFDIAYIGVWFREGYRYLNGYDQELADIQLQHFGTILSNEEAKQLVEAEVQNG